jgi:cobalt/nickel transport system permease protein
MKISLDKYAYLDSPIHRWYHPDKLISLLLLIFTFACIQKLVLLPAMLIITLGLYQLSGLPWSFLALRLRYPSLLILALVLLLPFVSGKIILWQWGGLVIKQEGTWAMLRIVTRFVCILTLSLILFGTAPFFATLKTLRSWGLPTILVDMMLLTYRYLEELADILTNMQRAMRLRGFQAQRLNRRTLQIISQLVATLLIRSYEQSKRVYQAMLLRGYHYQKKQIYNRQNRSNQTLNYFLNTGILFTAFLFILIEITI